MKGVIKSKMESEPSRNIKRQIAVKVRIKDLVNGRYVKEEGWKPNYIIIKDGRRVSRANLVGTVVAKQIEGKNQSIILDDGSAKISVRDFNENRALNSIDVGDVILMIGRPREYGNEKYAVPEILKKIDNRKWIEVRKLELEKTHIEEEVEEKEEVEEVREEPIEEKEEDVPLPQKIFNLIKVSDAGAGVDIEKVIGVYGEQAEKVIESLLKEGEIFEIKPGKLKVLE